MSYPNKKRSKLSAISVESLANIYLQLAKMEDAGIPIIQAFELIDKKDKKSRNQLLQMQRLIKSGNAIADSGFKAGLFNSLDKDLIQAGEVSGNLGEIYKQLAIHYRQKISRVKKIKSKCYLPAIVLIIALFIQPLPALILNEITGLDYLIVSMGRLIKITLFSYILFKLPFWLTSGSLQFLGLKNLLYSLQLKLPVISSWTISRQVNEFLRSLGLMLAAGVPILDALPKALDTITNPLLKKQFEQLVLTTTQGGSLTDGLGNISVMDNQTVQILAVGEKSGKLAKSMLHHAKIQKQTIDLQEDMLAEWIPRIFYFMVTAWVAASIIGGASVNKIPF